MKSYWYGCTKRSFLPGYQKFDNICLIQHSPTTKLKGAKPCTFPKTTTPRKIMIMQILRRHKEFKYHYQKWAHSEKKADKFAIKFNSNKEK